MWSCVTESRPKAAKAYQCQAAPWFDSLREQDVDPEDWATLQAASAAGNRILPGMRYVKRTGRYDGEWTVFRAREDLHTIALKYDLYED